MSYQRRKDDDIVEPLFAALHDRDEGKSEKGARLGVFVTGAVLLILVALALLLWMVW